MNTMPTFRRGRRIFLRGPRNRFHDGREANKTIVGRAGGWFGLVGMFLLLLVPLYLYFYMENQRFQIHQGLTEISNKNIIELPSDGQVMIGDIVHGSSEKIASAVTDRALGITIKNALTLKRNTEYCQWREIRREYCTRCRRTVRNEDGTTETESYDCDCVIHYDYVKGWQPHLINSLLFDQPAAHYNPQRNPMPSTLFTAQNAVLMFTDTSTAKSSKAYLSPDLLRSQVRGANVRSVDWVPNGVPRPPPIWLRWIPDRGRYEDLSLLKHLVRFDQVSGSAFTYVGRGYFFSPHESSRIEKLMKLFGEYLEGTLLDWQLGDIFPSCTAGDIRIKYYVQDPRVVSVLGQVKSTPSNSEMILEPMTSRTGMKIGFVENGIISASRMIENENYKSRMFIMLSRFLSLLWAFFISRRISFIAGYNIEKSPFLQQILLPLSFWSFLMGIVLSRVWGYSMEGNIMTSVSIIGFVILFQAPPLKLRKHI